jgi:Tfp pilus assembly protein PilZ
VFVATHSLPPIGSEIELRFSLPAGPELHTRGIVRWLRDAQETESAPPGIGVEFSTLAERELALIRAFIAQSEPTIFEG